MWNEFSQLQNIFGVWLLKLSIIIFVLRILGKTQRNFTLFLRVLLGVSTAVNISLVIIWFEQCTPLKAIWDFRLDHPKCLTKNAIVGVAYTAAGMRSNLNEYYSVADISQASTWPRTSSARYFPCFSSATSKSTADGKSL
jgi:hypothetical protein